MQAKVYTLRVLAFSPRWLISALKSPRLSVDSSFEYTREGKSYQRSERGYVSGAKIIPFAGRCGLRFGVYLGGPCEVHHELATGKPDVPEEINRVLDILQSEKPFLVRTYLGFNGTHDDAELVDMPSMPDLARYTWRGRKLDLVLSNWDRLGNTAGWIEFIENVITRYGPYIGCLQIGEEPNLYEYPGDGRFGSAVQNVLIGVKVARQIVKQRALHINVGFNAVPCTNPNDGFWREMAERIDHSFLSCLDYVGLNFYPDVATPLVGEMPVEVTKVLTHFREETLRAAGIPGSVPMHICENGWPTGPCRYYTRQAELIEQQVRTVYDLRAKLNITTYELFSLRDADTANPDPNHQFGILRDDYSKKPAFEVYRRLIGELG